MMNEEDRKYLYWLFAAPGIGSRSGSALIDLYGNAREVFLHREKMPERVSKQYRKDLSAYIHDTDPERVYEDLCGSGAGFTALPLPDYPEKLRQIPDPPFGITWLGTLPETEKPAIAVIGARQCSEYGRRMADRFGRELALGGAQVISGMAVGIDGLAQRGALHAGGRSFAILGSGADVCYPKENRDLYERLRSEGGIISEHPLGTLPKPAHFPMRNRLISGFCDALLVIEARRRSGTLITVEMALEQGRDIYALPGRLTDALSDGCHQLIRDGAGIATCAGDILESLFHPGEHSDTDRDDSGDGGIISPGFSLKPEERLIVQIVADHPSSLSLLAEELAGHGMNIPVPRLAETAVSLCARGLIRQEGGYYHAAV